MKRLFEIDLNEDFKRAIYAQYIVMALTLILCVVVRSHEREILNFSFFIEFILLSFMLNFFVKAQRQRNYAYWGISIILAIYIGKIVLQYTFLNYNIFILYISFLAGIFLLINCYVMSSPLFYPRVQWWEYDFRYRGDLKTKLSIKDERMDARLTDLRREACCLEAFEYVELDSPVEIEISYNDLTFKLRGRVKTTKQIITGRPHRYGIKLELLAKEEKEAYLDLKKIWNNNKKGKLRRKFAYLKGNNEL